MRETAATASSKAGIPQPVGLSAANPILQYRLTGVHERVEPAEKAEMTRIRTWSCAAGPVPASEQRERPPHCGRGPAAVPPSGPAPGLPAPQRLFPLPPAPALAHRNLPHINEWTLFGASTLVRNGEI